MPNRNKDHLIWACVNVSRLILNQWSLLTADSFREYTKSLNYSCYLFLKLSNSLHDWRVFLKFIQVSSKNYVPYILFHKSFIIVFSSSLFIYKYRCALCTGICLILVTVSASWQCIFWFILYKISIGIHVNILFPTSKM